MSMPQVPIPSMRHTQCPWGSGPTSSTLVRDLALYSHTPDCTSISSACMNMRRKKHGDNLLKLTHIMQPHMSKRPEDDRNDWSVHEVRARLRMCGTLTRRIGAYQNQNQQHLGGASASLMFERIPWPMTEHSHHSMACNTN
jgi:hypothetical protein